MAIKNYVESDTNPSPANRCNRRHSQHPYFQRHNRRSHPVCHSSLSTKKGRRPKPTRCPHVIAGLC